MNRGQAIVWTSDNLIQQCIYPGPVGRWIDPSGACLTKAYDVTIQRYRNSHVQVHNSKMDILQCMG